MTRQALLSLACAPSLSLFHSLSLYTLHLLPISPDASLLLQSENRSRKIGRRALSFLRLCPPTHLPSSGSFPCLLPIASEPGPLPPIKPDLWSLLGWFILCMDVSGLRETEIANTGRLEVFLRRCMNISRLSKEGGPPSPWWAGASHFSEGKGGTTKQRGAS